MKIKLLKNAVGSANKLGSTTMIYQQGSEFEPKEEWEIKLAHQFMESGLAEEIKTVAPTETKKVRARTKSGHYKSDVPTTPDINEAWTIETK